MGRIASFPPGPAWSAGPTGGSSCPIPARSSPTCPTARCTSSRRIFRSRNPDDLADAGRRFRRMHVDGGCGPARSGRCGNAPPGGRAIPQEYGPGDHRPVRRQPVRDGPILLSGRQFLHAPGRRTAERPIASSTGWWRSIWRISNEFLAAVGSSIDIILFGDDLGHADGPDAQPPHVLRVLQAPPPAALESGEGTGRRQGHAPLLRRRPRAAPASDRGGPRRDQPRPDHVFGDERGTS